MKLPTLVASLVATAAAVGTAPEIAGTTELMPESTSTLFTYEGSTGPDVWHTLDPDWLVCQDGQEQSPININQNDVVTGNATDIVFSYSPAPITIINNGKTLEFNGFSGNSMSIDGRVFNLVNIHFHATSEHTFNGGGFPAEMHFVHADANGALAVIGVMIVEGTDENSAFFTADRLSQLLPDVNGLLYTFDATLDLSGLLPTTRDYYHYMGSLTVPPCSENVAWHVMTSPITMSPEQVRVLIPALQQLQFASTLGGTNRPVQPINGRTIFLGQSPQGIPPAPPAGPTTPSPPTPPGVMGNITFDEITGEATSFDYNPGPIGPSNWTGFCQTGMKQSPVNIVPCDVVDGVTTPVELSYATSYPLTVTNTGKGLLFPNTNGGTATIAGRTLNLLQFHIHSLSEHTFQGGFFPMEFHFVHVDANDANQLAVLGVMIQEGPANPAFPDVKQLRQLLPTDAGITHAFGLAINYLDLMPADKTFFHYEGSLTTPPCSENVLWHVFEQPVTMSRDQINAFLDVLQNVKYASAEGYTNRPVQPLFGRTVYRGYPASSSAPTTMPSAMPTVPPTTIAVAMGDVILEGATNSTPYNYRADKGPDRWHELSPDWEICRTGTEQSPIDIVVSDVQVGVNTPIELNYAPAATSAVNKGSTLLINFPSTNTMSIGSRTFTLIQCHMHTTSEHTVNGASFPIEIHFVHADANSNLAVLGVMVQEGDASPVFPDLARLDQIFPDENGVTHEVADLLHFEALFPADRSYYHYFGSLTTPPCAEDVMWHVFRQPITMSKDQLSVLLRKLGRLADASELGMSNRPVLPLNNRTVYLGQNPAGLREPNTSPPDSTGTKAPEKTTGALTLDLAKEGPSFNYRSDKGPDVWHTLAPEWDICRSGLEQSPINIVQGDAIPGEATSIEFSYTPTPVTVLNNGKTLELRALEGNSMKIRDTTYNLVNIHMHHNSEHLFNGGAFQLEIHFVHADASGNLAVVGVMVEEGAANSAIPGDLKTFEQVFPGTSNVQYSFSTVNIDMTQWLPSDRTFYHYMGSLTVPPCSEQVAWHVMQTAITMSREQLTILVSAFKNLETASMFGFTHRPVQPLNGRTVTVGYPAQPAPEGQPTLTARVSFAFAYFSASPAAQTQFTNDFIKQMAQVLGVPASSVRITNLEQGSTIVTSTVTTAPDSADAVQSQLQDPSAIFSASNGWDTSLYGAGSVPSSTPSSNNDDDGNDITGDRLAIVIVVCILVPVFVVANLVACYYLLNRNQSAGEKADLVEKKNKSATYEEAMKHRISARRMTESSVSGQAPVDVHNAA